MKLEKNSKTVTVNRALSDIDHCLYFYDLNV